MTALRNAVISSNTQILASSTPRILKQIGILIPGRKPVLQKKLG